MTVLEPDVEARPWSRQLELDDETYREQLGYLLERSPFYGAKLAAAVPIRKTLDMRASPPP